LSNQKGKIKKEKSKKQVQKTNPFLLLLLFLYEIEKTNQN